MSYIGSTPANKIVTSSDMEDGVVSTDKLAANAVTTAKITDGTIAEADIANDAVTADKIANAVNSAIAANTSKTTNATHSGEVTGSGALTIADNVVDEANLKVSNSPTNGYNLVARSGNTGGMTWEAASGGANTPYFFAYRNSALTTNTETLTTIPFDTEDLDSGSGFNTSTGTYTIPSGQGGKYFFSFAVQNTTVSAGLVDVYSVLKRTGSATTIIGLNEHDMSGNFQKGVTVNNSVLLNCVAGDVIFIQFYQQTESGSAGNIVVGTGRTTFFTGFKLIE